MQVEVGAVYINKFQFGVIRPPEQYAGLSGVGSIAAGPLFALIPPCPHLRKLAAADARPLPGQSARSRAKRPVSPPVCALAPEANLRSGLLRGFYSGGATFLP
jgi:hypothetical protein